MRKLKIREFKIVVEADIANEWQSWNSTVWLQSLCVIFPLPCYHGSRIPLSSPRWQGPETKKKNERVRSWVDVKWSLQGKPVMARIELESLRQSQWMRQKAWYFTPLGPMVCGVGGLVWGQRAVWELPAMLNSHSWSCSSYNDYFCGLSSSPQDSVVGQDKMGTQTVSPQAELASWHFRH